MASAPKTPPPATGQREASATFIDAATLMRIKNLQLRAKSVVEGFYNGLHRSPFHGFSAEFSQYREYSQGDDPRYLDWRLFARSDRYYIKQFEDETNRRCYLVVDQSKSMGYHSLDYSKAEYARTLAATLAYYLTLQRDSVGLMTFDQQVREFHPARHRPGHMHRLMVTLEQSEQGSGTDLHAPLEQLAGLVRKRGLIVVISDLLASLDTLRKNLSYLRTRGHEVLLLRVLDPAEVDFPFDQATMFRDPETGKNLFVDPAVARDEYQRRFTEHDEEIRNTCANLGIDFSHLQTDEPLELALFDLLSAQVRRGRLTHRQGTPRRGVQA